MRVGEEARERNKASGLIISDNAIYVTEQMPERRISVSTVQLKKPGFVVIHEDANGTPGKTLGVSHLLPAGETENPPPIVLSRLTEDTETIYAMLHIDNGDGHFDASRDQSAIDPVVGEPVMMIITISKDATFPGVVNP